MADLGTGAQSPVTVAGQRSGRSRTIDSVDDAGTERLAVAASVSGVTSVDLNETDDEVAVFGGIDGSETANAATRQIINVSSSGVIRNEGGVAHDAADSGNPVKMGMRAIAHGTNPTAVAAADRTDWLANRAGVPWVMGGHPNIQTVEYRWATTDAPSSDDIILVSAGTIIVVTSVMVTVDEATTVGVKVRIAFGASTVPTEPASLGTVAGVIFSHGGIVPGGGATRGDGSGVIGVGGDGVDLRITATAPTSGEAHVVVTYYTIES